MRMLFIPYAVVISYQGDYLWQRNLGKYIDDIASLFNDSTILCKVAGADDPTYTRDGIPIYQYKMKSQARVINPFKNIVSHIGQLVSLIREVNLVYIFIPSYRGLLAAAISIIHKKQYAFYMGGPWESIRPNRLPLRIWKVAESALQLSFRWMMSRAMFTVTPSKALVELYGGEANKVYNTPSAVQWGSDEFFDRQDTCQGDTVEVLYLGAFRPQKGIEYLLKGFAQVLTQLPNLSLMMVGAGSLDYEESLHVLALELGLGDGIKFSGYVSNASQLRTIYRKADLLVIPSLSEGFPRVAYEAMSQGLPVIATRIDGITSVIGDRQVVYLVEPGSSESIAQAILSLIKDLPKRRRLITEGYKFALERMDSSAAARFFEQLLRNKEGINAKHGK